MAETGGAPGASADGRLLDPFFGTLETHWRELPGERRRVPGLEPRLRAEALLRLPGPWSLFRLREGLRCCVAHTPEHERLFEEAFAEVFGRPDPADLEHATGP